jgi:hypothetical protein
MLAFGEFSLKIIGLIANGGHDHCGNLFIFQASTCIVAELSHQAMSINPATPWTKPASAACAAHPSLHVLE